MRIPGVPAFADGFSSKAGNVFFGFSYSLSQRLVGLQESRHHFRVGYREVVRGQVCPVKTSGQLEHGRVTPGLDIFQNGARALLDDGIEQARGGGHFAQPLGKISFTVANHFHASVLVHQFEHSGAHRGNTSLDAWLRYGGPKWRVQ